MTGLAHFNRATTLLEDIHEALSQLDMEFVSSEELRQRVEAEFARVLPGAAAIRDALKEVLRQGPTSAGESVELAQRILQFLELKTISVHQLAAGSS